MPRSKSTLLRSHLSISTWMGLLTMLILPAAVQALVPVTVTVQQARDDSDKTADQPADRPEPRAADLVRVNLPITPQVAASVRQTIERLVERAPDAAGDRRPVIVLEFDTSNGQTGQGSQREACQSLASYLCERSLHRVQTLAYIPAPRGYIENADEDQQSKNKLVGHAVMVAIATDGIVMHRDSSIGMAGIDDQDNLGLELSRGAYEIIASHGATLRVPIVMSMVDPKKSLTRVVTDRSIEYVDNQALDKLLLEETVVETDSLSAAGELALLSSEKMDKFGLIKARVNSRRDLERRLNLVGNSLQGDPTLGEQTRAVVLEVPEYIDPQTIEWMTRSLSSQVASSLDSAKANLVILHLTSSGGDVDSALRMARTIAEYDSTVVRTVAFVDGYARGPAGLIALACDQIVMTKNGTLGGPFEHEYTEEDLVDIQVSVQHLGELKQRDWSMMLAMLNPALSVERYRHRTSGQLRMMCTEEFELLAEAGENPDDWNTIGPIDLIEGLDADTAEKMFIARTTVTDLEGVSSFYNLDTPPRTLKPTLTDRWIEKLASKLASPSIAPLLLFGAVFFLSTEMSAPGIGVPGFLGTLCLMAFFWSQHLDGNAHWLEILLFGVGVVFIALELFVIPGFGLFGIGGLLMVVISIVLASQTFIIPTTPAELAQLPKSLLPLVGAGSGLVVAFIVLRNVLPNTPYFKRMMLDPPNKSDETGLDGADVDRDAVVNWRHLTGKNGITMTRLGPAGKARIAGKLMDVITDGKMVAKNQAIEVVEVNGNRILVRAKNAAD